MKQISGQCTVCQIDRPASNAGSQPASTKEWGLSR